MRSYGLLIPVIVTAYCCSLVDSSASSIRSFTYFNSSRNAYSSTMVATDCIECALVGNSIAKLIWWTSAVPLTVDTIQYVVTQYNNTAITNAETMRGNLSAMDSQTIWRSANDSQLSKAFRIFDDSLYGTVSFVADTTLVEPDGFTMTYPTPYYQYSDFEIWTTTGQNGAPRECLTTDLQGYITPFPFQGEGGGWRTIRVPLNTTVYKAYPGGQDAADAISSMGNDGFAGRRGPFLSDFHEYLKSDTRLYSLYPEVKRCYTAWMSGAPSIKMRVSALTATKYSTIKTAGIYTGSISGDTAPKTASSVQPGPKASPLPTINAPPRSTIPVVHPSTSADPDGTDSNASPEAHPIPGNASPSSSDGRPKSNPEPEPTSIDPDQSKLPGSKPKSNSNPQLAGLASEPAPSPKPDIPKSYTTLSEDGPPPVEQAFANSKAQPPTIQIEGLTYTADPGFNYVIGSRTLAPGSTPVVVNNVPYALAPSATALFAGTRSIALRPGEPSPPVLKIGNQIHTADFHSRIVVGSQTLVPGGPTVIIDNTPYYLANSPSPDLSEPYKAPILTIAGQTYKPGPSSDYVIDGQTLKPGGPPITASGVAYALPPSAEALISGGTTIRLSSPHPQSSNFLTIDGTVYPEDSASNFVVGSQTLVPGGSPVTINHTPYALISGPLGNALIIGSRTSYLSPTTKGAALINIGSSNYVANAASEFIVGSQTLVPGGSAITIDHTPYSLYVEPSGEALVVGSRTSFLGPTPTVFHTPAVITVGYTPYTANAKSEFIIDGQTLSLGHPITINQTEYSLYSGASGEALVVGSSTSFFALPPSATITSAPAVITIGSALYTANAKFEFVIDGQTLSPGHPITIDQTEYSLYSGASGEALVVGSSTSFFALPPSATITSAAAVITIGSTRYTANANSEFIIGTQTLSRGCHAITVSGTLVSLDTQGTDVVVGTSTEAVSMGRFIMQGFGSAGAATPTTTSTATGAAAGGGGVQVTGFTGGANKAGDGPEGGNERWVYTMIVITIITRLLL